MSGLIHQKPAPLDPKLAALYGPRDLKAPGSMEWIIQTTFHAHSVLVSLNHNEKEWPKVVVEIDAQEVWKKYPTGKPYGTRAVFYRAELGAPEQEAAVKCLSIEPLIEPLKNDFNIFQCDRRRSLPQDQPEPEPAAELSWLRRERAGSRAGGLPVFEGGGLARSADVSSVAPSHVVRISWTRKCRLSF